MYWHNRLPIDCLSMRCLRSVVGSVGAGASALTPALRQGGGTAEAWRGRASRGGSLCATGRNRQIGDRLFTPRRDNSKGNIIALFNTKGVYSKILINMNGVLIITICILIWIGIPKSHSRRYKLAAGLSLLKDNMRFLEIIVLVNRF